MLERLQLSKSFFYQIKFGVGETNIFMLKIFVKHLVE